MKSLEKYGPLPELDEQINKLMSDRKKLEREKIFIPDDETIPQSSYEEAWDYQYELITEHPMRLNALLQSVGFHIKCYADGRIKSSTIGNELSNTTYKGFNRKMNTYELSANDTTYRISHPKSEVDSVKKLREMLDIQRKNKELGTVDSNKPFIPADELEILNFLEDL